MNKSVFDVFDNADDEMIEKLSSFTDDDDEVKKRILNMSERKYQNLKAGISENDVKDKNEITMSVADKRPVRWYKPLAAVAAVAVIIAGVSMITNSLNKYTDPSDDVLPAVQTETDSPVQSEAVTDSQSSEQPTDHTTTDTNLPSEDEMKELYAKFADFYSDINDTLISKQYELVDDGFAAQYRMKNRDNYITVEGLDNQSFRTDLNYYYEFNDERFSSLEEFNNYYSKFFCGTDCEFKLGKKYGKPDEERLLFIDETLEEFNKNGWLSCLIMECDDKLYVSEDACYDFIYNIQDINDYFSEHSFEVTENSFRRIRLSRDDDFIYATSVIFNKDDNNTWRIADVEFNGFALEAYPELGENTSDLSDVTCYMNIFPNLGEEILSSPVFEIDEELIQIPDFDENYTALDAEKILKEKGFHVELKLEYHQEIPEAHVISVDPGANKWRPNGSTVLLYISMGPDPELFHIPDVSGMKPDEARSVLENLGLDVMSVGYYFGDEFNGLAVETNIHDECYVKKGEEIILYIGTSNPEERWPDDFWTVTNNE